MSFWGSVAGTVVSRMVMGGVMLGGVGMASGSGGVLGTGAGASALAAIAPSAMRASPFYEATGRVVEVQSGCRVLFDVAGQLRRTEVISCTQADLMMRRPEFAAGRIVNINAVMFDYYGPDGTRILTGQSERVFHSDGRPLKVGDTLPLKARRDDPRIVHPI